MGLFTIRIRQTAHPSVENLIALLPILLPPWIELINFVVYDKRKLVETKHQTDAPMGLEKLPLYYP